MLAHRCQIPYCPFLVRALNRYCTVAQNTRDVGGVQDAFIAPVPLALLQTRWIWALARRRRLGKFRRPSTSWRLTRRHLSGADLTADDDALSPHGLL